MIEQFAIAITGLVAVFLSQSRLEGLRKWAPIFGLAGQPFWALAAVKADQWGIQLLTVAYTLAWLKGFWSFWISPALEHRSRLASIGKVQAETRTYRYTIKPVREIVQSTPVARVQCGCGAVLRMTLQDPEAHCCGTIYRLREA